MKSRTLVSLFALSIASFLAAPVALAAEENPTASTETAEAAAPEDREIPGVKLTHGPAIVKLGTVSELRIPEGYSFIGPDSLDKFYELTQNMRNGKEVGVVLSPENWMLFFDYDPVGYVKDDEKDSLDAKKMLASMEKSFAAGNEARRARGWSEQRLQGWAMEPRYDDKTNNLKWAFRFSSSEDEHKSVTVNQNIRLLGRGGIMEVTLVCDPETFAASEASSDQLLTNFNYVSGEKYAEYKKGDKMAEYGLAALVVGGAGVIAVKAGLLGVLAKFWKFIAAGVVAVGAGIARLWNKISGRNPPPQQ